MFVMKNTLSVGICEMKSRYLTTVSFVKRFQEPLKE